MRGPENWLWPLSIAGAITLHGGLGLLLAGTSAEAAAPPPPLEITISTLPATMRAPATESAVASEVAAVGFAEPVAAAPPVTALAVAATPSAAVAQSIAPAQAIVPVPLSPISASGVATAPLASAADVVVRPAAPVVALAAPLPVIAALATAPVGAEVPTIGLAPVVSVVVPSGVAPSMTAAVDGNPIVLAAAPAESNASASLATPSATSVSASAAVAVDTTAVVGAAQPAAPTVPSIVAVPAPDEPLQLAAIEPAAPAPPTPEETQAPALAAFVSSFQGSDCFAAHVETAAATPSLSAYAVDFADSVALQFGLSQAFDEPVTVDGYRAEPAQCAALSFVTQLQRIGTGEAAVILDSQRVDDGGSVSGMVLAPAGGMLLLIVDDEGKVADASAYLADDGRFSAPVRLTGEGAGKLQLVVAVAAAVATNAPSVGQAAAEFFPALLAQLVSDGSRPAVAIAAFAIE